MYFTALLIMLKRALEVKMMMMMMMIFIIISCARVKRS